MARKPGTTATSYGRRRLRRSGSLAASRVRGGAAISAHRQQRRQFMLAISIAIAEARRRVRRARSSPVTSAFQKSVNDGKRAACAVMNSRKSHCGTSAMKRNFECNAARAKSTAAIARPLCCHPDERHARLCGQGQFQKLVGEAELIQQFERRGMRSMSPRKSRRKSLCFSRTTTSMPARARIGNRGRRRQGSSRRWRTSCGIRWLALPRNRQCTETTLGPGVSEARLMTLTSNYLRVRQPDPRSTNRS